MTLSGIASIVVDGKPVELKPGDGIILPANTPVGMGNLHDEPVELMEACPVGTRVTFSGMDPFVPVWAE